jgi:hypothetical protein
MQTAKSKLVEGGRIIVPGDELRMRPARAALRRLQARLAPLAPGPGEPLVSDTLHVERRGEAADA